MNASIFYARIPTMTIIGTNMTLSGTGPSRTTMCIRMRKCATAIRTFRTFIIGTGTKG